MQDSKSLLITEVQILIFAELLRGVKQKEVQVEQFLTRLFDRLEI
jgi:hypothetical protein